MLPEFDSQSLHKNKVMWKKELERLVLKGIDNPYAIMCIIEFKEIHKFEKDWRKVIMKEMTRVKQKTKLK